MKKLLVLAFTLLLSLSIFADEGMWLLPLLKKTNIKDMQSKGLKLSAQDIYDINNNSLKDAIVVFGGGCTGEVVSPEGLLFTNHHCGFGSIQALSSVEHDYLKNGYWAMNNAEELPAPGLSVKFVRAINDVTKDILRGVKADMAETERQEVIEKNIKSYVEANKFASESKYVEVSEMFGGNQYFAFTMEVYSDVRFVGAPPQSVGKFGGETDNWMWPRHTGDFSVFRIYAAPDGVTPAPYAADNVPYKAPVHLSVSTQGYKEGDFAMILGFPGSTERYMTSYEIDKMLSVENPNRIYIRTEREEILKTQMASSDKVRIQYASKFASSSNYRKNSIGMSRGIEKLNVKGQKEAVEAEFTAWVNQSAKRQKKYGDALETIKTSIEAMTPVDGKMQVLTETFLRSVDIANIAVRVSRFEKENPDKPIADYAAALYKNYDEQTERLVTVRMLEILRERFSAEDLPFLTTVSTDFGGDMKAYVDALFDKSMFQNLNKFLASDAKKAAEDDVLLLYNQVSKFYRSLWPLRRDLVVAYEAGHRKFIAGLMEMSPKRMFYPDANFTQRLTYGTVLPYSPADGVEYKYYTTLKGVMDKEDPDNQIEFSVPEGLKALYAKGDFGRYADADGTLHTCFLSTNDITGGNSGSPVMNGKGELIGLAFDGNWEAMSGDIAFEPDLQRTINVDVRYVLFLIDRLGGAGWLLNEMTLK